MAFYGWKPYVPAAARRRKAIREAEKLTKQGGSISPVTIEGRTIAKTFWGKSWCENLERYGDYANRLPRGRTYVRNGSVVDLQIKPGLIEALVSGSELYEVRLRISPVGGPSWKAICEDCSGAIDSLIELLQGRFSKGVMERICRQSQGLFPSPAEIKISCSCPDWAGMCKHVAAVLYGVGARFDHQPELLFLLREVDHQELVAKAASGLPLAKQAPAAGKVLGDGDLSDMFGLDMAVSPAAGPVKKPKGAVAPATKKKVVAKKTVVVKKKIAVKWKVAPAKKRQLPKSPGNRP